MDTNSSRYIRGKLGGLYETSWQTPNNRKKTASSRPASEARPDLSLGRPETERFAKLGGALVSSLPEERAVRFKGSAQYGTAAAFVRKAEENPGAHLGERPFGSRLLDGSLDLEADRPDRTQEIPSELLHLKSLESDGGLGLELPETAKESQRTPGTSHPLLETSRLASYKKKPISFEPAWYSWMRADSRSFRTSKEPGRLEGERQRSLSPDAGPKSLPSLPSPSRRRGNDLDSTRASMPTKTFGANRSDSSLGISRVTSKDRLSFSGTAARSTKPSSPRNSLEAILASKPFTFRDMRLSLTPMNLFGQTSSEVWQTAFPETLSTFDSSLTGLLEDSGTLRDSYDRAFTRLTYRGHDVYPLFNESSVYGNPKERSPLNETTSNP